MMRFATMNMGRTFHCQVLAVCSLMRHHVLDALGIQEADVNSASLPRVVASFQREGFHFTVGAEGTDGRQRGPIRRCAIVWRMPVRHMALRGVDELDRVNAVVLEVRLQDAVRKIVLTNTYGHAACREQATRHHLEVLASLSSANVEWLLWGDFNVALDEDPAAELIASRSDVRALDDGSVNQGSLPGTSPTRLRRIDFGLSSRGLSAVGLHTFKGLSDHLCTAYDVPVDMPIGHSGPSRSFLASTSISEEVWRRAWRPVAEQFCRRPCL